MEEFSTFFFNLTDHVHTNLVSAAHKFSIQVWLYNILRLLIADKLEEIVAEQVKAISGVKIDKVTVWDGGQNADGKTSTANFLSGLLKSLPPLEEIYNMAGLSLPAIVAPQKEENKKEKQSEEKSEKKPKKSEEK